MNDRQKTADLAKKFYRNEIGYEEFLLSLPDSEDEDIKELLNLIEHQPAKWWGNWIFGPTNKELEAYLKKIEELIKCLSQA